MVERIKNFFLKFISGRLGLAVTFWLYGVLVALTLDFLTSQTSALWQVVVLAVVTFVHFILIIIAVWNASQLYQGKSIWKWLARVVALLNVAKWLWYLPLLIASISAALGFTTLSSDYWELNAHELSCKPALYQHTPENIMKKYQECTTILNTSRDLIDLRCQSEEINGDFFYTKSSKDCNKYLAKLVALKKSRS